jgi:hypothetical protein
LSDDLRGEIKALAKGKKIREELLPHGTQDLSRAQALVRAAIHDAPRWGAYYEQTRKRKHKLAKEYPDRMEDLKHAKAFLDRIVNNRYWFLQMVEPLAAADDPRSQTRTAKMIQDAVMMRDALDDYYKVSTVLAFGGKPSDDWILAFIWRMRIAWCELTILPVTSTSTRFATFVEYAYTVIEGRKTRKVVGKKTRPRDWSARIETAINRFKMEEERWLRPGEDLDLLG